ncbi:MAG: hypothetical protein BGP24_18365 [Lysobacterales bacterium 69-70]|nr:MAG: hypothetical protein ABS97_14675 [Xanthomonadaceae bacterium SCN 69-320]ODV15657.1 MAG: hypothetical protein ABT27_22120 [Xanthomonadaceae bacterium SCN 69-25]OJY99892.1 MAG: hypothetical protein BGP24_18365 [Xanthomonadales bacterium 69-70]
MTFRRVFAWSLLPAVLAVVVPVRRWLAVDACPDARGMFDYAQTRCRHDADPALVPAGSAAIR